jgi:LacI family transcriptional regulator/LacI family repressor for deo operon, udp, cdd, tsx, nupC, and nupG
LHDHPAIASQTVARIKRIAAELGYVPSAVARGLKTSHSHALGVIVSRIDDPFFSEIIQGIEDSVRPAGYSLFLAASNRDDERQRAIVQAMGERRVDGLIVCSTHVSAENGRQLRSYGIPVVVVDNQANTEYEYSIYHDDRAGSRLVTQHLIDLGHDRILWLGNMLAGRTSSLRLEGYQEGMRAAGLSVPAEYSIQAPNGRPDGGEAAALELLKLSPCPTAVMCFNDMMAAGVIRMLQAQGINVPEDCSVTGFDDILISRYLNPPLTTFHQPKYRLGCEAARMLLDLLPGKPESRDPQILVLHGELLPRASSGPPPVI